MTDRPQPVAVHDAALDQEVSGPVLPHDFGKFGGMLFQIANVVFGLLTRSGEMVRSTSSFPIEFPDFSDGFGVSQHPDRPPEERRLIACAGDLERPTIASVSIFVLMAEGLFALMFRDCKVKFS